MIDSSRTSRVGYVERSLNFGTLDLKNQSPRKLRSYGGDDERRLEEYTNRSLTYGSDALDASRGILATNGSSS
jgi:hypothetical protein